LKKYRHSSIELLKSKLDYNNGHKDQGIITFLNPFSYLFYRKNQELFSKFDSIGIDGQLLVVMLNIFVLKKQSKVQRLSFDMTSFAPVLFHKCLLEKRSIYFIGSTEKSIERFINEITKKYPNLKIVGFRNGYFKDDNEKQESITEVISKNPNFVIVGMGSPYQEKYLLSLKLAGFHGAGYSCGGFIHQTAKSVEYYPGWTDTLHLRWAYRIWDEPILFKRYFVMYPISLLLFLKDVFKYRFSK
jgi:N-acetylglucosaminyldiphosphoundecaprenol N-acetyl-beta-D-mannosaminyltransferase